MIDGLALMIPIVAVGGFFAWMISLSPVGKAYAEKVRAQTAKAAGTGDHRDHEEALEAIEQLRREVADLAERMDFAERLLAKGRDQRQGLPS
ncbi:MAG: hypothetical protein DMD71_01680 [Gemmatimonadetes bacterium]|nr:MAG: hypothetical protein DMD74_01755 [Gemmatimonadota bacterium]PYO70543.1 MAG: hypothetical protein DMD71_01680 [Gemmatimonadota bacterium]